MIESSTRQRCHIKHKFYETDVFYRPQQWKFIRAVVVKGRAYTCHYFWHERSLKVKLRHQCLPKDSSVHHSWKIVSAVARRTLILSPCGFIEEVGQVVVALLSEGITWHI